MPNTRSRKRGEEGGSSTHRESESERGRVHVVGGEDSMADALIADVGLNNKEDTGEGIYDAYIVQAPWLPPVYMGLKR